MMPPSTVPPTSTIAPNPGATSHLQAGDIALIVLIVLAVIIILSVLLSTGIWYCCYKKKK